MAVTYTTAAKTVRMQAIANHFASGTLELQSSGGTPLAIIALGVQTSAVTGDTWTLNMTTGSTTGEAAAGAGTAATQAVIRTSGATANITGLTVGTSGSDINLNNTSIASGQTVTISSATIQHA